MPKKPVYDEIKSFRLYRPGKVKTKKRKANGGWFRWLWSTGKQSRTSATKFFAMIFTFAVIIFYIGEGLAIRGITVPDSTEMLLAIFWGVYIGSNKASSFISAARADHAPLEEVQD